MTLKNRNKSAITPEKYASTIAHVNNERADLGAVFGDDFIRFL
jgi:hypothetical protein